MKRDPHSCWECRILFDELPKKKRLKLYRIFRQKGSRAAKNYIDDLFRKQHKEHKKSWV